MSSDDIWDEEQWEAYLQESDRRTDRYMALMKGFLALHPQPEAHEEHALRMWKKALARFLRSKGWDQEELMLPFIEPEEEGHAEEGASGWPNMLLDAEEDADAQLADFRDLDVYQQAFRVVQDVLGWADRIAGDAKDSTLVQFCNHVLQVPAQIAKGHAFGYDRETLGGNIACVKRGLAEANEALALLRSMRTSSYMTDATYRTLTEGVFELRNRVGLYVQELRERFNLGID